MQCALFSSSQTNYNSVNEQKWNYKMSFYDNFLNRKRQKKEQKKKNEEQFPSFYSFLDSHLCIASYRICSISSGGQKMNSYIWFLCAFCILKVTHQINWRWWARLKYYESQSNRNFNGSIRISPWWMLIILTIPFPYFVRTHIIRFLFS